jgi:hypothetical protein
MSLVWSDVAGGVWARACPLLGGMAGQNGSGLLARLSVKSGNGSASCLRMAGSSVGVANGTTTRAKGLAKRASDHCDAMVMAVQHTYVLCPNVHKNRSKLNTCSA